LTDIRAYVDVVERVYQRRNGKKAVRRAQVVLLAPMVATTTTMAAARATCVGSPSLAPTIHAALHRTIDTRRKANHRREHHLLQEVSVQMLADGDDLLLACE
jgi:hypothetical protein